jgi:hypothetical protein
MVIGVSKPRMQALDELTIRTLPMTFNSHALSVLADAKGALAARPKERLPAVSATPSKARRIE